MVAICTGVGQVADEWFRTISGFVRLLAKPRRIDGGVMTAILVDKTCTPCRGGIPPLPRPEAPALLAHASASARTDEARRTGPSFGFRHVRVARAFVTHVCELAAADGGARCGTKGA